MQCAGKFFLGATDEVFRCDVPVSILDTGQNTKFQVQKLLKLCWNGLGPRVVSLGNSPLGVCAHKGSQFRSRTRTLYTMPLASGETTKMSRFP